ncbi:hypothetical protein BUALT_Bualt07G0036400 [Buddleja alternifolia]|uniref:26S proteasome complex subunit SEM1 n=1 Tax=Buddleja alternifolia TaxID=168488 RepID=A0AAV6X7Z1_9LAMI|nr:hypothetical protein BUALT_Bualt07G0036400 [Buddleja alternifolia]
MKSHFIATQFRTLIRVIATALDVLLPLNSIGVSCEIKELFEMLSKQARKAKMEPDPEDENTMKRVIIVLNQFENKFEPDPFMIRKILAHLEIKSWAECHREIKFLDDQIRVEYLNGDEREIPLLSNLIGLLCYCRGTLFEDCDFRVVDQSDGRNSNLEVLSCLNPEDFRCPISLELMTDPVTVSTGQTYDRVSIQKWLKSGNLICPKTGEKLKSLEMVPNTNLKKLIHQFCSEYGVSLAKSRTKNRDISRTILPGSPANAEAVKFLSQFLTLSLGYGTDRQKKKAAYEIRLLAKSNLFNRSCLIESGSIIPLLELITSSDPEMQENTISALLKLSKQPRGQKEIIKNGGLNTILMALKNGITLESRQIAAATIFYLSSVHEHRKMIGENGETIPALLQVIKEGTPCGKRNSVVAIFALLFYHRNRDRAIAAVYRNAAGKEYCVSILHSLCLNRGPDVVSVLAKDVSLMSVLYSLLTEGTSHAGRKSRSLIKILQKFSETTSSRLIREIEMATEQPKPATEEAKMDLFEDDDEFEEFEIDQEWDDKEEGKDVTQQWEDDWDDDDVNDDFSLQLRRELESNPEKSEVKST